MSEFVEQCHHVVVGQQRWPAPDRRGEVANEVGDRDLELAPESLPRNRLIHPGAAALGFP